jgi:translation initiation factor 1
MKKDKYPDKSKNSRLVYSTKTGRVTAEKNIAPIPKSDGIIRIYRETKGRKGNGMSIIKGLPLEEKALKALAKAIKQKMGVGGSVKNGNIEIQSEQREKLKSVLETYGYTSKLAGG